MDFTSIITHMNNHHKQELLGLVKKFDPSAKEVDITRVVLESVDVEGLDIRHDAGIVRVKFPTKATPETMKDAIISLCMGNAHAASPSMDTQALQQEINDFAKSFGSVMLASLSPSGEVLSTYAPIIHSDDGIYIYISEMAEHYASIRANPTNVELMFIEDESKAHSVILRKRLRYRVSARFVERGSEEFSRVIQQFIAQSGGDGGVKQIATMSDFHLIELQKGDGRYVKGFGKAYAIQQGRITHLGGGGANPHNPHNPHSINKH